ncbi:MAG: alpha/beta hydrolase [Myxococcales bacterium]
MSRPKIAALRVVLAVGALLLGLLVAGASYRPNTEIPAGFSGHHVMLGDLPIRVLSEGQGRDVLLIHGCPGSLEEFRPLMDALARNFRVTAYDRPGHGFSGDGGEYSYDYNAQIAHRLIEQLGLQHVIVVGHSFGGGTALASALRKHPSVDAYVVVDAALYHPSRPPTMVMRALSAPWLGLGLARALVGSLGPRMFRKGIERQFVGHPPSQEFVDLRVRIWSSPKVAHALAVETTGATEWLPEMSSHYGKIEQPLVIVAQKENPFRREGAQRLQRQVAGSRLSLVANSGHYLQFEQPEQVVAAIRLAASATPRP